MFWFRNTLHDLVRGSSSSTLKCLLLLCGEDMWGPPSHHIRPDCHTTCLSRQEPYSVSSSLYFTLSNAFCSAFIFVAFQLLHKEKICLVTWQKNWECQGVSSLESVETLWYMVLLWFTCIFLYKTHQRQLQPLRLWIFNSLPCTYFVPNMYDFLSPTLQQVSV